MQESASKTQMAAHDPIIDDPNFRDLLVFHNVARALTSSLDRDAILRAIMQQMEQFFKPETWTLLLLDEPRKELYYAVAVGHTEADLASLRVPVGKGLAGWVAAHGESLIVPEVSQDPRFDAQFSTAGEKNGQGRPSRVRSAICMPLRSKLRTLGVIELLNCRLDTLSDYTISFLHVLCDYAAIAIENARAMERIQELTITDETTGLFNVRHLYRQIENEIERARRFKSQFSLIFIDLDYFKQVNDEFGHLIGSRVLAEVGQGLRSLVREVDSVFRYGGDEFIVLLPETGKAGAQKSAEHLLTSLRQMRFATTDGLQLEVRASFGVATFPEDGQSVHEVIRAADTMMYLVKGSTRDNVAVAGRGIVNRQWV
jgi:diguanylate cyclase (GGDEF)-like protein